MNDEKRASGGEEKRTVVENNGGERIAERRRRRRRRRQAFISGLSGARNSMRWSSQSVGVVFCALRQPFHAVIAINRGPL